MSQKLATSCLIHSKTNQPAIYVKITVRASRSRAFYRLWCASVRKNITTAAQPGLPSSQIHLQRSKYMAVGIRAGGPRWCIAVRTVGRAMCYDDGKIVAEKSKVVRRGLGELCALLQKRCALCWCAGVQCASLLASLGLGRTSIQDKLLRNLRANNLYVIGQQTDQLNMQQRAVFTLF